ncbi:MAG: ABC transporter ATP-binding protein [Desulfosalsimonadaceae bacterium]
MKLNIRNLCVTYGTGEHRLLAADEVGLELLPGRITALVGESGSGKTTLAKAVMGLLPDDARATGSIQLDEAEILGMSEEMANRIRWSKIAMVFQNSNENFNPVHRIIDQVAEPLVQKQHKTKAGAKTTAEKALEAMDLDPAIGRRYPHELSGGELQRCMLAMAFIMDPDIVILDEPTAALDAMNKGLTEDVMIRAKDEGKAILMITHDLELAAGVADDAVVLYMGQVMEVLPARNLFTSPRHPYTRALTRSFPGLETHRELGGIRGDAFYRVVHRHNSSHMTENPHSHIISPDSGHEDGHLPPQGCLFRTRCTQAISECAAASVPLMDVADHRVRCLREGIVTLLEVTGIRKNYGETRALTDVGICLQSGEIFCLVGESGSGKSTLAGISAGMLAPDRGERIFEDRDMDQWIRTDYRSLAGKIGVVHQDPAGAVSHRFSVYEIVAEPLRIQKKIRDEQTIRNRVLGALRDVHLSTADDFTGRYPHELNMGALQRVCIARALVSRPLMLVADEPTSSLDPSVQAKVLKMILDLQIEKGLSLLFITHDLGLARKIADRIGVMLAGRMVESGPASRILENPAHPYTRSLMNGSRGRFAAQGRTRSGSDSPDSCPFAARCAQSRTICRERFPGPSPVDHGNHHAWCHFPVC